MDEHPFGAKLAFGAKLELALKALSMTRARLAADLAVDKSLVSRWVSGAVTPSSHNLARLTQFIAGKRPGFTMLDWEGDLASLAAKLGVGGESTAPPVSAGLGGWFPGEVLDEAVANTAMRGGAYEGFWRSTRLSNEFPGRFTHDQILIRKAANGLLTFRMGVWDMRFEGHTFPLQSQVFTMAADAKTGVFLFTIFNAVLRQRAEVLDGVTLTCMRGAGGTPVAAAAMIERTGLLSGDPRADDARYEALIAQQDPFAPEGSIPDAIRDHLFRDIGPTALAMGGDATLMMAFANSISRGPSSDAAHLALQTQASGS